MANKIKPIVCWAVIYNETYDDGTDVYLPKLFSTRAEARQESNDQYPHSSVRKVKVVIVKTK